MRARLAGGGGAAAAAALAAQASSRAGRRKRGCREWRPDESVQASRGPSAHATPLGTRKLAAALPQGGSSSGHRKPFDGDRPVDSGRRAWPIRGSLELPSGICWNGRLNLAKLLYFSTSSSSLLPFSIWLVGLERPRVLPVAPRAQAGSFSLASASHL